jgi:hypothetical protein
MSKRVTKKQLLEQLEAVKGEKQDLEQRLYRTDDALVQTKRDLGRYRNLASVSMDRLQPEDQYHITMRVDRRHYHDGGRNIMRDVVLSMLSKLEQSLSADKLPEEVDEVFKRDDIKNFLAEWLFVTVYYPMRATMFPAPPSKTFWVEVLTRLFAAMDALKKAGLRNRELRQDLLFEAYNNPIKL